MVECSSTDSWCVCTCMLCADDYPTHQSDMEHGLIKIAHTGLNPQLGNGLQLQRMKSNYINCLPADGPSCFFSCAGTYLQL